MFHRIEKDKLVYTKRERDTFWNMFSLPHLFCYCLVPIGCLIVTGLRREKRALVIVGLRPATRIVDADCVDWRHFDLLWKNGEEAF